MKRSKFSLSHFKLLTCNQGELVPIALTEVLPGDTIQQASTALIRLAPLMSPVMHPVHARIHHWFVPFRLIWEDFEDFITGGPDGNDASAVPYYSLSAPLALGSLGDYLGIPAMDYTNTPLEVSALPVRAYNLIFNEWYRDQDLQSEIPISKASGLDETTPANLLNVNWEKDYFTSARPDTQKGDEVYLPMGNSAPVTGNTSGTPQVTGAADFDLGAFSLMQSGSELVYGPENSIVGATEGPVDNFNVPITGTADLTSATSVTINDLREAFALQRYAEARMRYGSRYTEYLRYLGVRPSDARLQRPEYLGGGKQTIQFSEVLQTGTDFDANSGVGNLKGHGIAAMRSNRYRRFFEEHGYVISLLSVKPKTVYSQGIAKTWLRKTKEDFFQRELQHIGMQEIKNAEVYATHTDPLGAFGFQDRYDEYRRHVSTISGEFRDGGGLEHWHMARIFESEPALNDSFVKANPTDRIYAATSSDQLQIMVQHSIQARRMLAKVGNPGGV